MAQKTTVRVPRMFFDDHAERGLDAPAVLKTLARQYEIDLHDPHTAELLDDAEYYADINGPDAEHIRGLKASARATVRAIQVAKAGME